MEIFKLFGSVLIKTDEAENSISKTESKAKKFAGTLGKGITTAAKWGAGLAVAAAGAATAVVGALLQMDEKTKEYRENQEKLTTAWEAAGGSAELAKQAYNGLYSVIGDSDTATEAGQLLAKLATSTEDVAKWTDIAAGVTGTFGDALPINSLIEASNETAKVGQVTGALADALNWAGISEDEFNEKLAACGTEQERNKLITETLSTTYQGATEAFKENSAQTLAARDAQLQLDEAMAKLGGAVADVKTKLLSEFGPAIADIVNAFVDFTNGVDGAEEQLQRSIQNMVDKIVQKLPDFLSFGIDVIVAIVKGLIQNLPYLLEQAPEIIDQLVDAFLELGGELLDVGSELMGKLWDGIKGVWADISGWVQNKVDWLADKLFFWRSGKKEMSGEDPDGSHASGLPYVPYDGYKAVLHRGESVLNAASVSELMDAVRRGQSHGDNQQIVINITETMDGQVMARRQYKYNQREMLLRGGSLVGGG
ncbi:hypothetical protein INF37_04665 [Pseudoflavonifractor sp. DSM 107456]|uniref:Phage tail tape measure protein n=1 Tax=Pseudoflavonifractor gallinarum TaxID=2779352 RepID=A0ABR9R9C6_9FIRM|nr:hypothetical protein [Pseudoflavonifractor gallinarum]MBE5055290.1 hypothetical protein [Pseudoflavonifractor gallinarum]